MNVACPNTVRDKTPGHQFRIFHVCAVTQDLVGCSDRPDNNLEAVLSLNHMAALALSQHSVPFRPPSMLDVDEAR